MQDAILRRSSRRDRRQNVVLEVVAAETYPIAWMQSPARSAIAPSILPALHIILLPYSAGASDVRNTTVIPKLIGFRYGPLALPTKQQDARK